MRRDLRLRNRFDGAPLGNDNAAKDHNKKTRNSGALDRNSAEADEHADRYYESVRKMRGDVKRISKNTGFSEKDVEKIKSWVFYEKHELDKGFATFDSDYDMAESWRRLIEGKSIQKRDITLLNHELLELTLCKENGITQSEAHAIASEKYNYQKECMEAYVEAKKHNKIRNRNKR